MASESLKIPARRGSWKIRMKHEGMKEGNFEDPGDRWERMEGRERVREGGR